MSNPSQLGSIQFDDSTLRSPSPTDCSAPTSPCSSSFETPTSEYFVHVIPKKTMEEGVETAVVDERGKAAEVGHEVRREQEEGREQGYGNDTESGWEHVGE